MFRFTIRELVLLTLVVAMGVGWWLDRSRLAFSAADYQRLKVYEAGQLKQRLQFFEALRAQRLDTSAGDKPSEELRSVPGDNDYQFPPEFPLHYGKTN
jgi:hypothetical protein